MNTKERLPPYIVLRGGYSLAEFAYYTLPNHETIIDVNIWTRMGRAFNAVCTDVEGDFLTGFCLKHYDVIIGEIFPEKEDKQTHENIQLVQEYLMRE